MQNLGGPLSRFQNPCKNEGHAISILLFIWVQKNFPRGRITFQIRKFQCFFWCALLGSEATVFYVAALKPVAAEKESYEKVGGEEEISS